MLKRWRCCVPGSVDIECNECHLLCNSPFKWALSCTYDDFAEKLLKYLTRNLFLTRNCSKSAGTKILRDFPRKNILQSVFSNFSTIQNKNLLQSISIQAIGTQT